MGNLSISFCKVNWISKASDDGGTTNSSFESNKPIRISCYWSWSWYNVYRQSLSALRSLTPLAKTNIDTHRYNQNSIRGFVMIFIPKKIETRGTYRILNLQELLVVTKCALVIYERFKDFDNCFWPLMGRAKTISGC